MNAYVRRGIVVLGAGAAGVAALLLGLSAGGTAQAGKGPTVTVAGTNWDFAPAAWAGPTVSGDGWAGPTVTGDGWAGPTVVRV
ncbi:hypothetical protein [Paractinoplanes rishiriensis]|uniref:Uncharacterized protein n=1 Tax=Paractinoplanes rishiriensis TaxID=1050105 RepID=A0A919K4U5_9ACTN|nr:hypothetical protein [Actinoplanes rishiriensis]GIE99332.1 hypothetical protein Ari01nite_67970 [Actinoplanes rishiriensis]